MDVWMIGEKKKTIHKKTAILFSDEVEYEQGLWEIFEVFFSIF